MDSEQILQSVLDQIPSDLAEGVRRRISVKQVTALDVVNGLSHLGFVIWYNAEKDCIEVK